MKTLINICGTMTAIIAFVLISFFAWKCGKWVNYKFAYESGIESTVKTMVKQECLKEKE